MNKKLFVAILFILSCAAPSFAMGGIEVDAPAQEIIWSTIKGNILDVKVIPMSSVLSEVMKFSDEYPWTHEPYTQNRNEILKEFEEAAKDGIPELAKAFKLDMKIDNQIMSWLENKENKKYVYLYLFGDILALYIIKDDIVYIIPFFNDIDDSVEQAFPAHEKQKLEKIINNLLQ